MKPRHLYLLEVALAVGAAVALVLLSSRQGAVQNDLPAFWPWAR
jgi:hypothetical protein